MSKENIMHTYGRFSVTFESRIGSRLFDVDGKEYIDLVSGVAVNCLGYSQPTIINAINEQSKKTYTYIKLLIEEINNVIKIFEVVLQNCVSIQEYGGKYE